MRQDILTTDIVDRKKGGTVTHKMERGTAGELLFIISGGSWNHADIITIKLRHRAGVDVVVDRVPALLLALLCDLKRGRPSTGTQNSLQEVGEEQGQETVVNTGQPFFVNAFKVNIGHISLQDAMSELDITVNVAKAFGGDVRVKIANIEPKAGPDYINQYDISDDLESTHLLVREVYLFGKKGVSLLQQTGDAGQVEGKDIRCMVYTDSGTGAYETDLEVMAANTSIDGELSHSVSTLIGVYSDPEPLPTPSIRFKVSGEDKAQCSFLFIKEKMIQALTSASSLQQIDHVLRKTEAIEKMDDSVAKAYRHAGSARKSEEVKEIKDKVEAVTPAPASV